MELFRQEALDHVRQRLWGEILIISPPSTGIVICCLVITLFILALYLYSGKYSLEASGRGELIPKGGIAKVYASKAGTISSIFVKEGDLVTKGQRLFSVETSRTNEDGSAVDYALIETTKRKIALIGESRKQEASRYAISLEKIKKGHLNNQKALKQLNDQISLQEVIVASADEILDKTFKLLDTGHVSKTDFNALKEKNLNNYKQLSTLRRQKIEVESSIELFSNNEKELFAIHEQKLLQLEKELLALKEKLITLENDRFTFVTAPKNGIVTGLQAVAGSTVQGRIPLVSILPEEQELIAHLYIPASAIGFVEIGQTVKLMFDAYDFRKFGAYSGKITDITDVFFTPSEVPPSISISEPSYRLTVKLAQQHINAYGKPIPLRANMRISADINLASRRLYEWFIDPFVRFQKGV